ncbi:SGNH/GDSL hydrolase family protein [Pantoea cypripedii]|uniref:SGNH/GDSL hydrolase family protein n=1 Tax=Pantoea cypripedii TaxID=55209 RepID=UPI002FCB8EDC
MTSINFNGQALLNANRSFTDEVDSGKGKFLLAEVINSQEIPDSILHSETEMDRVRQIQPDFNPDLQKNNFDKVRKVVIIGDSLSDENGLMFKKTHEILPSDPQFIDGKFTNGYTWVKFLSMSLNLPCYNMAEGGAVSANYSGIPVIGNPAFLFVSNLEAQIKKSAPGDDSLVFIFLGANDYMTFGKTDVTCVVSGQKKQVERMIDNKVSNIVIMGMPDLSLTPYAHEQNEEYRTMMHTVSEKHNNALKVMVKDVQCENPQVKIVYIDTHAIMSKIMEVAKYVNYDLEKAFFNGGYVSLRNKGKKCTIDHENFFNDKSHPSQEVHSVFARAVEKIVRDEFGDAASHSKKACQKKVEPTWLSHETSFDINFIRNIF